MADNVTGLTVGLDTDKAIENAKKLEDALIAIENVVKQVNKSDLSTMKEFDFGKMMKGSLAEAESTLKGFNTSLKNGVMTAKEYDNVIALWRDKYKEVLKLNDSLNAKVIQAPALQKGDINKIKGGAKLTDLNIPQTEQALKVIENQIAMMGDKINKSYQQRLVNSKAYYSEELKFMRTSTDEKERLLAKEIEAQRKASDIKLRQAEKEAKEIAKQSELASKQAYQQKISTVGGAMGLPDNSISQRTEKIRALQAVQQNLNKTDADYATNLSRVNNEMRKLDSANKQATTSGIKLDNAKKRLINTADQLTRRFALIFSVSQITGYVNKLIEVRGELELQNKALAAIIQNKNAADKLFGQITELSVKSPFQLKELITYTKQLAAYRFETEKLYDTTKMLGDISSGIGVSMDRLILALGQVKAANYLRGQELRQFSEAGINILGELADKFSEVQGRAISTGDVFEMVSNRMVTFKDVEDVFKSMTSAGGIFYNMQELQAETLIGKVSNLTDAIDIMLNKIGIEQESTLKGAIDAVRYLVENYDDLLAIIQTIVITYGVYVTALKAATLWQNREMIGVAASISIEKYRLVLKTMGIALLKGQAAATAVATSANFALSKSMLLLATNPYVLIATALAGLVTWMLIAKSDSEKLNKELVRLQSEDKGIFDKSVSSLKELSLQLKNTNKGSKEHIDLIRQVNSKYGEYLPFILNEATALSKVADAYDDIVAAMKRKQMQDTYEKSLQEVQKTYGEKQEDAVKSVISSIREGLIGVSEKDAKIIAELYVRALAENAEAELKDIAKTYLGKKYFERGKETSQVISSDMVTSVEVNKSLKNENNLKTVIADRQRLEKDISNEMAKQYQIVYNTKEATDKANQLDYDFNNRISAIKEKGFLSDKEYNKIIDNARTKGINEEDALYAEKKKRGITEIEIARQLAEEQRKNAIEKINLAKEDGTISEEAAYKKIAALNQETVTITDVNNKISNLIISANEMTNDRLKDIITIKPNELEGGIQEIQKATKDSYDVWIGQVDRLNKLKLVGTLINEKELENAKLTVKAYAEKARLLGIDLDKGGSKGKDTQAERIKEQIKLIKDAQAQYEKLRKQYDAPTAKAKTMELFAPKFDDYEINFEVDFSDIKPSIQRLGTELGKSITENSKKAIKEETFKIDLDAQIDTKFIDDIRAKMAKAFENFELTLELETAGVPTDLVKSIFPNDYTSQEDLFKQTQDRIAQLRQVGGTNAIKDADELQSKLDNIDKKGLYDRMKNYYSLIKENMSIQDQITKITEDGEKERAKITEDFGKLITKETPEENKVVITAEMDKAVEASTIKQSDLISNLTEQLLQQSQLYKNLFGDISDVGSNTLKKWINDFQSSIDKAKKITSGVDIGKNLITIDGKEYKVTDEVLNSLGLKATKVNSQLKKNNPFTALKDAIKEYDNAANETSKKDAMNKIFQAGFGAAGQLGEVVGELGGLFETLGVDMDGAFGAALGGITKMLEGLGSMDITKPFSIITGAIKVIGGLFDTIFNPKDAKLAKVIEKEKENVEKLAKAYEKLQKAKEAATNLKNEQASYEQQKKNLAEQEAAIERAQEANADRKAKNREDDAVYQEQLEENAEKLAELEKERLSSLGVFELKDAISELVDAWEEAYYAGENTFDALDVKVKDFVRNVIKQMAVMSGVDALLKPMREAIVKALEGDSKIDKSELEDINKLGDAATSNINEYLKSIYEGLGIMAGIDADAKDNLSGLQKGIQGITEETGGALEALLNTIVYEMFRSGAVIESRLLYICDILAMSNSLASRSLTELSGMHSLIKEMRAWQNGITKAGHPQGGDGIKAWIS